MSLRPVEVGYIDRPDHPSLRDSGCSEKSRSAFAYGLLLGAAFGAVWGLSVAYRCKHSGRQFADTVLRNTGSHACIFSGIGFIFFAFQCY